MIADTFIKRPITAIVISMVLVIVGTLAILNLPVSQYPDITPPVVQVSSQYIGADASNVYDQMAKLGFARVLETDTEIHVESNGLTHRQKRYLNDLGLETGREVIINSQQFIESKDPRAKALVDKMLK